jgi:hypothetical protein
VIYKRARQITTALFLAVLFFGGWALIDRQVRSQEAVKPKAKTDQHWRVVPDIAPVDLQRQLKILNDDGVTVSQTEIVLVGDKFTIMVCDPDEEQEDEE